MTASRIAQTLLLAGGAAACLPLLAREDAAQPEEAAALDTIIVERAPSELDSVGRVYEKRLPCIGECEEEESTADALQRLLEGVETLFIASSLPEKPEVHEQRGVVNPVAARLDEKQP